MVGEWNSGEGVGKEPLPSATEELEYMHPDESAVSRNTDTRVDI